MKKTLSLSIGGMLFHVEDDAYEKLDSYLASVRSHFSENPDREEILSDIEGRIAERFSEKKGKIVNLADVDEIIRDMGTADQFDDIAADTEDIQGSPKGMKQLFRDQDNAIIAGVSSGLGHFFGVDPLIFRLIFVFSLFLGGSGIIVYIILWILVPEAKTPSQKLSMRGTPVTISAMTEMLKEKIEEVNTPKHKSTFKKFALFPIEIIHLVVRFITRRILPFMRIFVGLFILLAGLGLAIGATFGVIFALFHLSPNVIEGPFLELANSPTARTLALSLYLVALIPLSFIISFGGYMVTKRASLSRMAIVSLLGIWFIAIPVAGAAGTKIAMRATEIMETDPYYKVEKEITRVAPFSRLVVTDSQSVKIVNGENYTVEMRGSARSMPNKLFTNATGTMTFTERDENGRRCLFCSAGRVEVIVTVPDIDSVHLTDSSHLYGEYEGDSLSISADNSSSYRLDLNVSAIDVAADDSSYVHVTGTASSLSIIASNNSRIDADMLETELSEITVKNASRASVYVKEKLNATATNSSYVEYAGEPELTEDSDASSRIEIREDYRQQY